MMGMLLLDIPSYQSIRAPGLRETLLKKLPELRFFFLNKKLITESFPPFFLLSHFGVSEIQGP